MRVHLPTFGHLEGKPQTRLRAWTDSSVGGGGGGTQTLFYDDFDPPAAWNLNVSTGANGAQNNFWQITDDEGGVLPNGCGIGGNGNRTLHITSVFCPSCGAAYDAGGLCPFICPQTNRRAESPVVSTVGFTNIQLNFDFISNGQGLLDNASVWYNAGAGWVQLAASIKSPLCFGGQGQWTAASYVLPAVCENIPNLRIGFNWTNNDDAAGGDPSVAINNVQVTGDGAGGAVNVCIVTDSVVVGAAGILNGNTQMSPSVCNGSNDGSAWVSISGGTGVYTYLWAPGGATNDTIFNLVPGNYTVTATDVGSGCTYTGSVLVWEPPALVLTGNAVADSCGQGTGLAVVNVTGGTPGYSYSWNTVPPQLNDSATGLSTGNYTATVTDLNGCQTALVVAVGATGGPTISNMVITPVSCFGGNDGMAVATATGGTPGYIYTWATVPVQLGNTAQNLTAGVYNLVVEDMGGCFAYDTVTISQPLPLVLSPAFQNEKCGQANGLASVSVAGGNPGYTYSWNTVPVQINDTAMGLVAGNYQVVVTDTKGCQDSITISIVNDPGPTVSASVLNPVSCQNGNDGSVTATPNGGTAPYQFSWNTVPVQNNQTATGLLAGTYTVTLTDAGGCTATASVSLLNPPALTVTGTSTNETCGLANGTTTANPAGGTPGYTYSWNTVPVQTTQTATGLTQGIYTVTVTDAKGCTATRTLPVNAVAGPSASLVSSTNVSCNGGSDGTATGNGFGGFPPYQVAWNTNPIQTGFTATGLAAGIWTMTVTDQNGCTATATATITEPTPVLATVAITNTSCEGTSDGSAVGSASGGNGNFQYAWNTVPPQAGPTATGLAAGNYLLTVSDASGCTGTVAFVITEPLPITITTTSTDASCEANDGTASALANGGAGGFTYAWNTFPVQVGPVALGLTSGIYSVIATDVNGCSQTADATVGQAQNVIAGFTSQPDTGFAVPLSNATFIFTNTSQNATAYTWTFGDGNGSTATDPSHTYEEIGEYQVTLIAYDPLTGCADTISYFPFVVEGDGRIWIPTGFTPNGDGLNDVFEIKGIGIEDYEINIFDRWGQLIFQGLDLGNSWNGLSGKGAPEPEGVYVFRIRATFNNGYEVDQSGSLTLIR